jgi:tetratricopeptide (TPR) repeat protein
LRESTLRPGGVGLSMGDDEIRDDSTVTTVTLFLDYAEQFARGVNDSEDRSKALALIAGQYAQADELDAAADVAGRIGDSFARDGALADVAARAVEFGDDDLAEELLGMIDDPVLYGLAVGQMAVKYAEAGEFDRAFEMARELDDDAPTLNRMALLYGDAGEFERAAEVAGAVGDPDLRGATYAALAAEALRVERRDEAAGLVEEAAGAAGESEFSESRISALTELASLYKGLGEDERALEALSDARRLCDDFEGTLSVGLPKTFARDEALVQLAAGFAGLKRFDLAEQVAEEIENAFRFASALTKVALAYHAGGDGAKTSENLAEALEVAREEEVVGGYGLAERDRLLAELADGYLTAGDAEEALRTAGMISVEESRHEALRRLATLWARSEGDGPAFRAAEMIGDVYARTICWLDLAEAFADAGHPDAAARASSRALSDAEAIEHAYGKASALMDAASASARRGEAEAARALLRRSLTAISSIRDNYQRALALVSLAGKSGALELEATEADRDILEEMVQHT